METERQIIRLKVPVPAWRLIPGESLMADIVSKNREQGTVTFRAVGRGCDGKEATLRIVHGFEVIATGKAGETEGGLNDKATQERLL